MFAEDDLRAAVAAGALTEAGAQALRAFDGSRAAPAGTTGADEEAFRLITGFNDIFVAIAIVLTLFAAAWLLNSSSILLAASGVAVLSWFLAEQFTRVRRMALPSIVLVLAFGLCALLLGHVLAGVVVPAPPGESRISTQSLVALSFAVAAAAAHWWRFRVPITVALGVATAWFTAALGLALLFPSLQRHILALVFAGGLVMFATALWFDMRDPARVTRRSDVAFWLHLGAAPLIVHPVFATLGLLGDGGGSSDGAATRALAAIAIYIGLALVALVIDRRAVLVSGLGYVLYAGGALLGGVGSLPVGFALTGLVVGALLLAMSAFWRRLRSPLVRLMPRSTRLLLPPV